MSETNNELKTDFDMCSPCVCPMSMLLWMCVRLCVWSWCRNTWCTGQRYAIKNDFDHCDLHSRTSCRTRLRFYYFVILRETSHFWTLWMHTHTHTLVSWLSMSLSTIYIHLNLHTMRFRIVKLWIKHIFVGKWWWWCAAIGSSANDFRIECVTKYKWKFFFVRNAMHFAIKMQWKV